MADQPRLRLWHRIKLFLVGNVPEQDALCEFDCPEAQCTVGKWRTCENRLRDVRLNSRSTLRELEEVRTKSGGIQLRACGAGAGVAPHPGGGQHDVVARLESAKALLDKGLISDGEYEALKMRIVNTL